MSDRREGVTVTATGDEALVGRLLNGRYAVGKRIARGGMASVFMATDTRLDRVVAVKIMHAGLGDDEQFTERFVREARVAAQLNHPNVVSVFDQGTDGDVTYLVMEYVPGETLRDLMRKEAPMAPGRALALIEEVLIALSTAHAAHMIHRDVKPENVLIAPDGTVKVADFGLARAVSAVTTATGGTLIGTVSYLAPEIVVNDGADPRSDVYACGAILYEMMTGFKPHAGDSPIQIAYKHVHEDVPKPSESIGGIPPYVDALVERCTARNRDQRSADALVMLQQVRQVRRALDAGLNDDPELTRDLLPPGSNLGFGASALNETTGDMPAVSDDPEDPYDSTVVVSEAGSGAGTQVLSAGQGHWFDSAAADQPPAEAEEAPAAKSRRGLVLGILVVILTLIAGAVGWYFGVGRYVEAPALVGMTLDEAEQRAESDGFEIGEVAFEINEDEPRFTVLGSSPPSGERILPGGSIDLTVSDGRSEYEFPAVRDLSEDDARARIAESTEETITISTVTEEFHNEIAEGNVIRALDADSEELIEAGSMVENKSSVILVVSQGREPVDVPDVVGSEENDAVAALEAEAVGLNANIEREFSDDVDEGLVIRQSPEAGDGAFRGDTVTIVVSQGPESVEVPDVRWRRGEEAEGILEDLGFEVEYSSGSEPGGFVMSWSPTGEQDRGTTITLTTTPVLDFD